MPGIAAQLLPAHPFQVEDLRLFHRLVTLVVSGDGVSRLLDELARHLALCSVALCLPESTPPDLPRVVVIPLYVGERTVGELYAGLPAEADSIRVAARLAFFAPVLALAVAAKN